VKLGGVGELHAAFLAESRTHCSWIGQRTGNSGRTSVRGSGKPGEAHPLLCFFAKPDSQPAPQEGNLLTGAQGGAP
jgi:hypothetical protein